MRPPSRSRPTPPTAPSLAELRAAVVDCTACARLRTYCAEVARTRRAAFRDQDYWGRPVPGFGDPDARVLIIGLAPAAHGANRTGRVFTGDNPGGSGDFLMRAMHRFGFASLPTTRHIDDGLALRDAYITAAVKCAPPQNKPTSEEIERCRRYLRDEMAAMPRLRVVVALGRIAFDSYWRLMRDRGVLVPRPPFRHNAVYQPPDAPALVVSYHPSRQNTNTGRLTPAMMDAVFRSARRLIETGS